MEFSKKITWLASGRYVVAVSGGVDSVALLDLLVTHADTRQWGLVPAHFNHGWPGDDEYEDYARRAVGKYGLKPVVGHGHTKRTEAAAREARYAFLREVMRETGADAIITAHQRDDVEETVLLNLLRGTGRHGLSPFGRTPDMLRPLVAVRKAELKAYAADRKLEWCHDTYNDDLKFRRNYVRHQVIPRLEKELPAFHELMAATVAEASDLNVRIDAGLAELFAADGQTATAKLEQLRRLDLDMAAELLLAMARAARPGVELGRRTVEQLAADIKTGRLRTRRQLANSLFASSSHDTVTIVFTP